MVLQKALCIIIGYVFGLFQTGFIIGKMHKTDIREHGSGNAGTTNALRTFGKKAGAITLLGDCLKCVLAIVVVRLIFAGRETEMMPLLCIYAAALFFTTHYVSLCSLTSYLTALIAMIVIGETSGYGMDRMHTTEMYLVMTALTVLAFWRHRANIVRLLKGTESKVFLSKSKTKKG